MTPKEFFYTVSEMRSAQRSYFATRDRKVFLAARKLENIIDDEIYRVKNLLELENIRNSD